MQNGDHHQASQSQQSQQSAQPLIAVIDDDSSVRAALNNLLHSAGYDTCSFDSAETFLAGDCLRTASCAIMDITLSAMSGIELKEHLASLQIDLPVVFISGNGSRAERERAAQLGTFLCKPIDADTLLTCVRRVTIAPGGQE